jgi:hypothetical protein
MQTGDFGKALSSVVCCAEEKNFGCGLTVSWTPLEELSWHHHGFAPLMYGSVVLRMVEYTISIMNA